MEELLRENLPEWYLQRERSSSKVRLLSVNVCVAASGLNNARLPLQTISAGLAASLVIHNCIAWIVPLASYTLVRAVVVLISLLLGHVVGAQAARVLGLFLRLLGCHDYKEERLHVLAKRFAKYDVVAVQELYEAWPRCLDSGFPLKLAALAAEHGLVHVAVPDGVVSPSFCMSSGLMILSRYPIECQKTLPFRSQFVGSRYGVSRGALYARVKVPKTERETWTLHVFTCHMDPSLKVISARLPASIMAWGSQNQERQVKELCKFIQEQQRQEGNDPFEACIMAGDVNANVKEPSSTDEQPYLNSVVKALCQGMASIGLYDCAHGKWMPTFGYRAADGEPAEYLLTSVAQRGNVVQDDMMFVNKFCHAEKFTSVPMVAPELGGVCTHLTDHWGLSATLSPTDPSKSSAHSDKSAI